MQTRLRGIALCALIALAATAAGSVEHALAGRAWIEPLVLAILIGAAVRTAWTPDARWKPGIDYSTKQVLEVAIVLLGLTLDVPLLLRAGPLLAAGIVVAVVAALGVGYLLGRTLGLRTRLAMLVGGGDAVLRHPPVAPVGPGVGAAAGGGATRNAVPGAPRRAGGGG